MATWESNLLIEEACSEKNRGRCRMEENRSAEMVSIAIRQQSEDKRLTISCWRVLISSSDMAMLSYAGRYTPGPPNSTDKGRPSVDWGGVGGMGLATKVIVMIFQVLVDRIKDMLILVESPGN